MKLHERIASFLTHDRTDGFISMIHQNIDLSWSELVISTSDLIMGLGNPPLILTNVIGDVSVSIPENSYIQNFFIKPLTGTPSIRIGTTVGGNDILDDILIDIFLIQKYEELYNSSDSIYFTISGGKVNIRVDLITSLWG